jgi:N-acetylmuramoyl-L-alanine amidase
VSYSPNLRFFAAVLAAALAYCSAAASELKGVRFGITGKDATRIVLDVDGPVAYAISGSDEGFGRISLDLKGISASSAAGKGQGHVAAYTVTSSTSGAVVALRLAKNSKVKSHFVIPPANSIVAYRVVIDLETAPPASLSASLGGPAALAEAKPSQPKLAAVQQAPPQPAYEDLTQVLKSVTAPTPAAAPQEHYTVVIDPGHGGSDPGASSAKGVQEKTITLASAKRLAEMLNAKGRYRVVLTRADDTRLSLEERSKAARDAGADLFISLHADSNDDAQVRGGSLYTLSEEGTVRSAREVKSGANSEVYATDLKELAPGVGDYLLEKAQTYTRGESAAFAQILIERLKGVTPLVNNSLRQGDLKVLLSPDVPAVLFELAYISNAADCANLSSPQWREKTMSAVVDSIDRYFDARLANRHAFNSRGRISGAAN